MTIGEAQEIYKVWVEFVEFADKFDCIFFGASMPESLLPFPRVILEEALDMIAELQWNAGDKKMVKAIEDSKAAWVWNTEKDEVALESMKRSLDFVLRDSKSREITLSNLKQRRESWAKTRKARIGQYSKNDKKRIQ